MPSFPTKAFLAVLLICKWMAASSLACSVPVFRYALERWPPDLFEATVFYRNSLSTEKSKALDLLTSSASNLKVTLVDLDATDQHFKNLWAEQETNTLPWLYVTYPETHPVAVELASGPLNATFATSIVDTSVRREIAHQLAAGKTAVWVLLESGDTARDDAAWSLLSREIDRLESSLELPTIEQEDIDAGLISVEEDELSIAFSGLRLQRDSTVDEMFVRMLLDTEEDLIDSKDPIVFPIFGRGRVLYGIIGEGISAETLELAATYLTGACSCQVKEDNPGVDLLMDLDWDSMVETSLETDRELPELTGVVSQPGTNGIEDSGSEIVSASEKETPQLPKQAMKTGAGNRLILWASLGALSLLVVSVAVGSLLITRKKT